MSHKTSPGRVRRDRRRIPSRRRSRLAGAIRHLAHLSCGLIVVAVALAAVMAVDQSAAYAAEPGAPVLLAADSIEAVVNNIRNWLVGILVAVATLFLTVGGLRYLAANGDPSEVEKGKLALKSAAIGYALALLAPLFVTIVGQWVA